MQIQEIQLYSHDRKAKIVGRDENHILSRVLDNEVPRHSQTDQTW